MSYARVGPGSDVYLIGTVSAAGNVIECCGCLLVPRGPWPGPGPEPRLGKDGPGGYGGWYLEEFPRFTRRQDALDHLAVHRRAGHQVPEHAVRAIREDDWVGE